MSKKRTEPKGKPEAPVWEPGKVVLSTYSFAAKYVAEKRPDCIAQIGLITVTWSGVETSLGRTLGTVLGKSSPAQGGAFSIHGNWIVDAVMGVQTSNHSRMKISKALFSRLLEGHSLLQAEWGEIAKQIDKITPYRNRIVHSWWAWSEDYPDGLIEDPKTAPKYWKLGDFENLFREIERIWYRVEAFQVSVLNATAAGEITTRLPV